MFMGRDLEYNSIHLCIYPSVPHVAPTLSPPPRSLLLPGRRAHGDRQGALRQIWAGAFASHTVHTGEEIPTHLLAGTTPSQTTTQNIKEFMKKHWNTQAEIHNIYLNTRWFNENLIVMLSCDANRDVENATGSTMLFVCWWRQFV